VKKKGCSGRNPQTLTKLKGILVNANFSPREKTPDLARKRGSSKEKWCHEKLFTKEYQERSANKKRSTYNFTGVEYKGGGILEKSRITPLRGYKGKW